LALTAYGRNGGSAPCRSRCFWSWSWGASRAAKPYPERRADLGHSRRWPPSYKVKSGLQREDRQPDEDENDHRQCVPDQAGKRDPSLTMLLEIGIDKRHYFPIRYENTLQA